MNVINKIIKNKYTPYILLLAVMLFFHLRITMSKDDLVFSTVLTDNNLFNWLILRYNTWSSRLFIEFILAIVCRLPIIIWELLDCLLYVLLAYNLSCLFNTNNDIRNTWLIVLLCLIYPFLDMNSAGYIATTVNYLWPLCGLVYILLIIKRTNKLKVYEYVLVVLATLITTSQELSCLLLIGFISLLLLKDYLNKNFNLRKERLSIAILVFSLIYLLIIITCKGNSLRLETEIRYMPDFNSYALINKVYLACISTIKILSDNFVIIGLFSSLLMYELIKNKYDDLYKYLGIFQFIYVFVFILFNNVFKDIFLFVSEYNDFINSRDLPITSLKSLLTFTSIIVIIIIHLFLLNKIFKTKEELFILLAGCLTRLVMGFSPTLFIVETEQ